MYLQTCTYKHELMCYSLFLFDLCWCCCSCYLHVYVFLVMCLFCFSLIVFFSFSFYMQLLLVVVTVKNSIVLPTYYAASFSEFLMYFMHHMKCLCCFYSSCLAYACIYRYIYKNFTFYLSKIYIKLPLY